MKNVMKKKSLLQRLGIKLNLVEDPDINAGEVSLMSRYNSGRRSSFEAIVDREEREINDKIDTLIKTTTDKLYSKVISEDQKPLYQAIKKRFEDRGFNVFYGNSKNIPELKTTEIIFISWDITAQEEKQYLEPN